MNVLGIALLALAMQAQPVEGIVVRKGTGEPLSKATVELRRDQENAGILDSMTTEEDGRFSFANVAPGRYRLIVARRGYARPPLAVVISPGAPGQRAQDIRLNMTATASISGRVVNAAGRPMGNVEVKAMKASYPEGRRLLTPVQSALTNDLGEYRLFWLPAGRYYVAAVHPKAQGVLRRVAGSGFGVALSGPFGTLVPVDNADPAIRVDPRAELESQSAAERYAPIFFGGTTDEDRATGIDLRAAADFGGVNIVVAPVQARHVRGAVVDGATGKPARYGSIALPKDPQRPPMKEVEVDRETGAFDFLLFPGSYTVTAASASGEGYVSFTLGDADIDNLIIPTTPAFELQGRIVVVGAPLRAPALEALHITLRRDPPRGEEINTAYDTPRPDGSFTLFASAGDFRVNIAPILNVIPARFGSPLWTAFQGAYVKSMRLGNADILNSVLRLERQPSAALEVVIATNPGALQGQVVRSGRETVADTPVLLVPDNRRRNELFQATTTDASGRFHFDRIPPGDYKVFSWEEVEDGAWHDAEFMKGIEIRGISVRIAEGVMVTARVEVIP